MMNSVIVCNATSSSRDSFFRVFCIPSVEVVPVKLTNAQMKISGFYFPATTAGSTRQLLFANYFLVLDPSLNNAVKKYIQHASNEKKCHFLVVILHLASITNEQLQEILLDAISNSIKKPLNDPLVAIQVSGRPPRRTLMPTTNIEKIKWKNPVFRSANTVIAHPPSKGEVQELAEFIFRKNDLDQLHVLGQVDSKFIAIKSNRELFLMDQHAADERVKLEAFLCEYETLEEGNYGIFQIETTNSALREGMTRHRAPLEKIGIQVSSKSNDGSLLVTFKRNFRDPAIINLLEKCIAWFDERKDDSNLFTIPTPVLDHFKSKGF